jgi:hypothetical protein
MPWTGWQQLNGSCSGGIEALGQNADSRLEVFGFQPAPGGQSIAHNWQTAPNSGWNGWASLGSPPQNDVLSHVGVSSNADGRLQGFVRYGAMSVGAMWTISQTAPSNGWSSWSALNVSVGNVTSGPIVVVANADGRLELFATAEPAGTTHAWQTSPGGSWSAQVSLGSPGGVLLQNLAAALNADGRLDVFAQGSNGAIWHITQTSPNNGWGSWASLGKPSTDTVSEPVVGTNADGRLEVHAVGTSGVWHAWQTTPGGSWSGWASFGAPVAGSTVTGLAAGQNLDGRQEVFASVNNGDVWHIWQTAPNNGWSAWDGLGGEPSPGVLVGRNQGGRLEIFVQGRGGGVYHRWQTSPGGSWS